ncbi:shikimate kinase [Clostridium rectalis]|uniref:shikimate kinase n=1 Tax=Clostridium rectalis TaxID=2040295 RepID=UPI000F62EB44
MPGAGKSTLGRMLALKLNCKFIDTDKCIEERENMSVSSIFKEKGENYFRNLETQIVSELSFIKNCVISTGGGTPIFNNNLQKLNALGTTVFLNVSIDELFKRNNLNIERPLLKVNMKERLSNMYKNRLPIYNKAKIIIDITDFNIKESLNKILQLVRK